MAATNTAVVVTEEVLLGDTLMKANSMRSKSNWEMLVFAILQDDCVNGFKAVFIARAHTAHS